MSEHRQIKLRLVTLADAGTVLTISAPSTAVEGEAFRVEGRLTDETGTPLPSQPIDLAINGVQQSSTATDGQGFYAFDVTILDAGTYTLTASFAGAACTEACETYCQVGCEVSCETGCQVACQTVCQYVCEATCEISCQATCEVSCQESCEISCQTGCQVECQTVCMYVCETPAE